MSLREILRRLLSRLLRRRRGDGAALARIAGEIARRLPPGRDGHLHVALGPDSPVPMGALSAHARLALGPALAPLGDPFPARGGHTYANLAPPAPNGPPVVVLGRGDGSGTVVHADGGTFEIARDATVG